MRRRVVLLAFRLAEALVSGFSEFVAAAQVGVRKAAPPSGPLVSGGKAEETALREIGALALMRRAGRETSPVRPLLAAPPEKLKVAHRAAEPLLEAFKGDETATVVTEWALMAATRGFVAPPETLTRLVPRAVRSPETRAVLGERGRWLAEIMGVEFSPIDTPEALRLDLEQRYEEMDSKERGEKIAALANGLGSGDEPILVRAMEERRKETREAAADLLLRLPGSALVRELCAFAKDVLAVERSFFRKTLRVEAPEPESLPSWLRPSASLTAMSLGPRAHGLFDLVAHIPPSYWVDRTGMPPAEIIECGRATEYGDAIFRGWQAAARRFWDQIWLDALFSAALPSGEGLNDVVPRHVSPPLFEPAAIEWLRGDSKPVLAMLANRSAPFSPALSRAVVEAARRSDEYPYPYRPLGRLLDLAVAPLLTEPWGASGSPIEGLREHWHRIIDLRARLQESLQ